MNTIVNNQEKFKQAISLAKGRYQLDVITGRQNLSGSDLRGKAKAYSGRYATSRKNLLSRLFAHNLVEEKIGENNKRILVIG